jgi:hypothetical protein
VVAVRSWTYVVGFCLLLLALELPVLTASQPPLIDYPNHLARMHLIAEGGDAYWRVHWGILPNLAEDVFVWALAGAIPVETAARAFLFLTVALNAFGVVLLARAALGAFRLWSLLGLMFVWSASLLWGFLNYTFGLGLAYLGGAAWLALDRRPALRAVVSVPLALAVWFSHIEAFAIYAILIIGFDIEPFFRRIGTAERREAIGRALLIAPPLTIPAFLTLFVWRASASQNWEFSGIWRKPDLIFNAFDNYNLPFDIASLVFVLASFAWMLTTRRMRIVGRAIPALLLLFVAFLASPNHLYSGGGADHRLPAVILTLFVAAGAANFRTRRESVWILGSLLALLVVRLGVVDFAWSRAQGTYARDLEILNSVRPGATVAVAHRVNSIKFSSAPELHMPLMATVLRDAFVPTLFAFPEQQPIQPTSRAAALIAVSSEYELWSAFVDRDLAALATARPALSRFDYLVLVGLKPFQVPADAQLTFIAATPTFKLFAIKR